VKEGELGEAAGGAKLLFRPVLPIRQAERFPPLGEVELAEKAGDPDIDGKSVPAGVGVEQHTAGNFGTDAGELLEVIGGTFRGPGIRNVQELRLFGEDLGGGGEVFGAVAELALAEPFFTRAGEALGRGEVAGRAAESAAEAIIDLADLDDLFEGGADEVGETFPGILAEGAEAGMGLAGLGKPRVLGLVPSQERIEFQVKVEVSVKG
jgi:hypothetical protein